MDRLWTAELVEARLVEAFAALKRAPALSTAGGILKDVEARRRVAGPELIVATDRLLGSRRHEPERSALLVWAKNRAGVAELTIPQFCERRGFLTRQGFDKMRRRGATVVADGLNAVITLLDGPEGRDEAA